MYITSVGMGVTISAMLRCYALHVTLQHQPMGPRAKLHILFQNKQSRLLFAEQTISVSVHEQVAVTKCLALSYKKLRDRKI